MSLHELMNVVSETDTIIDILPRSEIYKRRLYFRVINAFIINKKGQLWILLHV